MKLYRDRSRLTRRRLILGAVLLGAGACNGGGVPEQTAPGSQLLLVWPAGLGKQTRPAPLFDHDGHTAELKDQGCVTCHQKDGQGRLIPKFMRAQDNQDRAALMKGYHDGCVTCHKGRAAEGKTHGPVTCGECHVRARGEPTDRKLIFFDYDLHFLHVRSEKDQCQACHHQLDSKTGKLVYQKGQELACRRCHGATDQGKRISLQHAAHQNCVSCHLRRQEQGGKAGPLRCAGCHGNERKVRPSHDPLPRLKLERQPDHVILGQDKKTKAGFVSFDHLHHEVTAPFCTSCHHYALDKCQTCHASKTGKDGGVSMEDAHHLVSSSRSCVGCHRRAALQQDCAGCHAARSGGPQERSCQVCHTPKPMETTAPTSMPAVTPAAGTAVTVAPPAEADRFGLPPASETFPETVVMADLSKTYLPTTLPHRKMAQRLNEILQQNKLARTFHGSTQVLCAGCHHRTPLGQKPPRCQSCHPSAAGARKDIPALKAAYHRQCVGCHQKMGLKAVGCTDCHARAAKNGENP
jgi:hypothetical protein